LKEVTVCKPHRQCVGGSIGKPANSNTPRLYREPLEQIAERTINELNVRPGTTTDDIPRISAPRVRCQDEDATLVGDALQHQNERHWVGEVMTHRNIQPPPQNDIDPA
jgi:hypothetical protein